MDPIFGRDWISEIKLDWADIKSLNNPNKEVDIDNIFTVYADVFDQNIGMIPNTKGHIQLIDKAQPIFIKPRPLPYALKPKVERELERLKTKA